MTSVVTSGHHETLKSGRMVAPGQAVTATEAKQNPRLVERGALTEKPAPKQAKKPAKTASKEDDK